MLDRDLAEMYGVATKVLKQAVRRNMGRFPEDFMFEMTPQELTQWRSQIVTSIGDKMGLRYPPFCFTEQGVAMLSSVLGSEVAIPGFSELLFKNHKDTKAQRNTEGAMQHNKTHKPLSARENELAKKVVNIAFKIHTFLGPGLLESVYERCFCYELTKEGIAYQQQKLIPIKYGDLLIDNALKIDLLVDDLLIIELKAQENYHPVWEAQLLSYLKLSGKRIGYLINFHVSLMKNGFQRFVM